MKTLLALFALWAMSAAMLWGCASLPPPEPKVVTKLVEVPVVQSCFVDTGKADVYPDTDAALRDAANLGERIKLLLAGRKLRIARADVMEAAAKACAAPVIPHP